MRQHRKSSLQERLPPRKGVAFYVNDAPLAGHAIRNTVEACNRRSRVVIAPDCLNAAELS